jgi:prepilin-type processing-associated H-X9-DG protein
MGSFHPGGCNFVMGDGSVHFVSEEIDLPIYKQLGTVAGGEPASLP